MPEDRIISLRAMRLSEEDAQELKANQERGPRASLVEQVRHYVRIGLFLERQGITSIEQLEYLLGRQP